MSASWDSRHGRAQGTANGEKPHNPRPPTAMSPPGRRSYPAPPVNLELHTEPHWLAGFAPRRSAGDKPVAGRRLLALRGACSRRHSHGALRSNPALPQARLRRSSRSPRVVRVPLLSLAALGAATCLLHARAYSITTPTRSGVRDGWRHGGWSFHERLGAFDRQAWRAWPTGQ